RVEAERDLTERSREDLGSQVGVLEADAHRRLPDALPIQQGRVELTFLAARIEHVLALDLGAEPALRSERSQEMTGSIHGVVARAPRAERRADRRVDR